MKFDYYKEILNQAFFPEYHFKFSLTEDEVIRAMHKYGYPNWTPEQFEYTTLNKHYQMLSALSLLQDAATDKPVDLGINYKEKYEELEELLKPYKIDDEMTPATTLKMILKYHK